MNFSVEKNINVKKRQLKVLRQEMIEKEKLHINDSINYEKFLELYNEYGKELSQEDFARIYLDISISNYYNLKSKKEIKILKEEEIEDEYICRIKLYIIKNLGLTKETPITYEQFQQIYNSIPTKLSEVLFADKILDITYNALAKIKNNKLKRTKIFQKIDYIYFDKEISEKTIIEKSKYYSNIVKQLKNNIAQDRKLHIGDKISYTQFQEIYQIYGEDYTDKDFAVTILGISEEKARKFLNKKIKEVEIWNNEILDLDSLLKIRKNVINEEGLHIKDKITYEQFRNLYEKYAENLPEKIFAEEILDILEYGFRALKKGKFQKLIILTDINISQELENEIGRQIKENENLYRGKEITYEQFLELYKKYAYVMGEKEFAEKILKMNLNSLKSGITKVSKVFYKEEFKEYDELEIKQLGDIVIKENKLHIGQSISGETFERIYKKYNGFGLDKKSFGEKILDIKAYKISSNLKNNNKKVIILSNEIVSEDEIKNLRENFIKSREYGIGDMIDYKEFTRLYYKYGGKLSEKEFAENILFITKNNLKLIKSFKTEKTAIYGIFKLPDTYIANLKANVIEKYSLYHGQRMTPDYFDKIYEETKTILSKKVFAKKILEVNIQDYYNVFGAKKSKTFGILGISGDLKNKKIFSDKQNKLFSALLEQGYDYKIIARKCNLTVRDVISKANRLFEFGFLDKEQVTETYIKRQVINGEKLDEKITKGYEKLIEEIQLFKKLEERCGETIKSGKTENRNKQLIKYIDLCQKLYNNFNEMSFKTVGTLQNVLKYLKWTKMSDNLFCIKACISKKDFKSANGHITFCMNNPKLTLEEKKKLQELRTAIVEAKRKDTAMQLIGLGYPIEEIMRITGVREVDIREMKKNMRNTEGVTENEKKVLKLG